MCRKIEIEELKKCGKNFIKKQIDDEIPYSRYDSWDFCYEKFINMSKKEELSENDKDILALNLAFYLASWGMYRGSSFLLQNNYRIHIEPTDKIIKFIKENRMEIDEDKIIKWENVKALKDELTKYYQGIVFIDKDGKKVKGNVTDTLVTKILLGTTGIVPAYDTNVKYCLKKLEFVQTFGEKSYNQINKFYDDNYKEIFNEIQKEINEQLKQRGTNIKYPRMKTLDMCLWEYYNEIGPKD